MPGGVSMHPAAALGTTIDGRRMVCLANSISGDLAWAVPNVAMLGVVVIDSGSSMGSVVKTGKGVDETMYLLTGPSNRIVACAGLEGVWLASWRGVILAAAGQPEAFA